MEFVKNVGNLLFGMERVVSFVQMAVLWIKLEHHVSFALKDLFMILKKEFVIFLINDNLMNY